MKLNKLEYFSKTKQLPCGRLSNGIFTEVEKELQHTEAADTGIDELQAELPALIF